MRTRYIVTALLLSVSTFGSAQDFEFADPAERDALIEQAVADLQAEPSPFDMFHWYGEELFYDMEIWGGEAARCALQTGYPEWHDDMGWVVPVAGLATSTGLFAAMFPMHDSGLSYLDPATMLPVWAEKVLDERGVARTYQVTFEREEFYSPVLRLREGETRNYSRWLPGDTHDAFSWIQTLRTVDLTEGAVHVHYIFDGWKLSRLTATVQTHTSVYTGLGLIEVAEFSFVREVLNSAQGLPFADSITHLPPVFDVTDGPIDLGRGWVSLDERRLPVGVEIIAPEPLGAIRVMLTNYNPPNASYVPDPELANVETE